MIAALYASVEAAGLHDPPPSRVVEVPARQAECLAYLYAYWREHGRSPTQREIAQAMGLRTNSAAIFVAPLERKGLVKRARGQRNTRLRRNLRLTAAGLARAAGLASATPAAEREQPGPLFTVHLPSPA